MMGKMNIISWLLEPMGYEFMQRGMIAAVLVGIVCAVVGTYVVLRGMAFFGDALAHTILPGIALGYLLMGGGPRSALLVGAGHSRGGCAGDWRGQQERGGQGRYRHWNYLCRDVRPGHCLDLYGAQLCCGFESLPLRRCTQRFHPKPVADFDLRRPRASDDFALYKEFLTLSFDPILATTLRLPVGLLNNLLLTLIAVTVAVSLQTVGVALMVAMLVTPAATAYLLTRRLSSMMVLAAIFASLAGVIGLYLSFYLSIASGAAIVLTATFFFLLSFLWKRVRFSS